MDTVCRAIHKKICDEGGLKSYIILDEYDFLNCLSEEYGFDDVKKAVKLLKDDGCIDVKYCRGNAFCVTALKEPPPPPPPAVPEQEICAAENTTRIIEETTEKAYGFFKAKYALLFVSSFFGGAFGSLIVSLIFAYI